MKHAVPFLGHYGFWSLSQKRFIKYTITKSRRRCRVLLSWLEFFRHGNPQEMRKTFHEPTWCVCACASVAFSLCRWQSPRDDDASRKYHTAVQEVATHDIGQAWNAFGCSCSSHNLKFSKTEVWHEETKSATRTWSPSQGERARCGS
jgi:hypothetical protein